MKRLLFLSSTALLLGILLSAGCKVKKDAEGNTISRSERIKKENEDGDVKVIPAPGVQNQKELDSIKNVRTREKSKPRILYNE